MLPSELRREYFSLDPLKPNFTGTAAEKKKKKITCPLQFVGNADDKVTKTCNDECTRVGVYLYDFFFRKAAFASCSEGGFSHMQILLGVINYRL